ncbi:MucBP domain-containing protein [Gemella sp.]
MSTSIVHSNSLVGDVTVSYETPNGVQLKPTEAVVPKGSTPGTSYDTTTSNYKPERIEKDGKVYLLREKPKAGSVSEKGQSTTQPENVTYVYEEKVEPSTNNKTGSVIVNYVDKDGNIIADTQVVKRDEAVGVKYDTTSPEYKPSIIEKDGKKYVLKKVTKYSDAEKSDVKGRTSVITYVYDLLNLTEDKQEAKIGLVVVNYIDQSGNPISGKTLEGNIVTGTVVDTDVTLVGTPYDTTDNKPTMIIAENGDVYVLVKTNGTENGLVKEGVTKVDYVYKKLSPITPTPEQPIVPVPTPGNPTVPTATPGQPVVPTTTPEKPVASKGKLANTGIESTSSTVLGALSAMLGLGGLFSKNRKSDKE